MAASAGYRTMVFRRSAMTDLLESPRGAVGAYFAKVGARAVSEAKSLAAQKLQRGTGTGPHYADSFKSSVDQGPRLRLENDRKTASGRLLAPIIEHGSRPHIIRPRKASILVFEVGGQRVFAREVHHPGTKPLRIMETAIRRAART